MSKAIGSNFDDFLKEDGIYDEVRALTIKKVIALDLHRLMKKHHISKSEMAERMQTSRAQLDRLLNPENTSVTLLTLARAARALGKKLSIRLESTGRLDRQSLKKAA